MDFGYISKHYGSALFHLNDTRLKALGRIFSHHSPDDILVAVFIKHSPVGTGSKTACSIEHLLERHVVMAHPLGIEEHLIFLEIPSYNRDLRHSTG